MSLVLQTPYGTVRILEPKQILNEIRDLLLEQSKKQDARTIGLTGGSTPKKFYEEMATQPNGSVALAKITLVGQRRTLCTHRGHGKQFR